MSTVQQTGTFIRTVIVPPCSAHEALKEIDRSGYLNDTIVAAIPNYEGGEVSVTFLYITKKVTHTQATEELANYSLKPAPFVAVAKVNKDDPAFADKHPNATILDDSSFAVFYCRRGERKIRVYRSNGGWSYPWWLTGVPI